MMLQPLTLGREKPLSTNLPKNEVVADLERIFKPLDGRALVPAFHYDGNVKRPKEVRRRKWRRRALVAPVLLIVAIGALTFAYEYPGQPAPRQVGLVSVERPLPIVVQTISPLSANVDAIAQGRAPVAAAPKEVPASAQRRLPMTYRPAVVEHPIQRLTNQQSAPPKLVPPLPPPAAPALAPPPLTVVQRSSEANRTAVNPLPDASHKEIDRRAQCLPGSSDDRCIYQDVMNADARLRRAFNYAVQGGVSQSSLSLVLREWSQARRQSTNDPDQTIDRYEQLVNVLDRAPRVYPK